MAEGNFREYLKGETVWVKKYFYALRPILACKWIEAGYGVVPIEFEKLTSQFVEDDELKHAIEELLKRKREGQELDREPRIHVLSAFIEKELERLGNMSFIGENSSTNTEKLDEVFRWILKEVW
jgi:predicted nucleotidyltransferase